MHFPQGHRQVREQKLCTASKINSEPPAFRGTMPAIFCNAATRKTLFLNDQ